MFVPAKKAKKYLKMLVYGSYGVGKTPLALRFPKPCAMIDLEYGSEFYGGLYEFDIAHPASYQELEKSLSWLSTTGRGKYQTVIVDSLSVSWEMVQEKWLHYYRRQKGQHYDISFFDWAPVKEDWRRLMRHLIELPMHVVVTCREKQDYDIVGNSPRKNGVRFDCAKDAPYYFSLIVHLSRNDGVVMANVERDRTMSGLPRQFPANYSNFAKIFENDRIESSSLEDKLRLDMAWIDEPIPEKGNFLSRAGGRSWREAATDQFDVSMRKKKDGNFYPQPASSFLHVVEKWNGGDEEIRLKAKIALEKYKDYRAKKRDMEGKEAS